MLTWKGQSVAPLWDLILLSVAWVRGVATGLVDLFMRCSLFWLLDSPKLS